MKRLVSALMVILILGQLTAINSHAGNYADEWLKKQQERDEKRMDELEKEGTLTQEAIDCMTKGKSNRKPNAKSSKKSTSNYSYSTGNTYTGEAKGWVYGADELHVTGLPTDPTTGYTLQGDYGRID